MSILVQQEQKTGIARQMFENIKLLNYQTKITLPFLHIYFLTLLILETINHNVTDTNMNPSYMLTQTKTLLFRPPHSFQIL